MNVNVEMTIWCESIKRGCTFTARITDGANAKFYAGQGDTAFEAIAWCLDDYVRRALLGHAPSPARRSDMQPGEGLAAAPSSRPRTITPAPIATGPVLAHDDKASCFERVIPTAPAPRLFSLAPVISSPTTKTKRRARGGGR